MPMNMGVGVGVAMAYGRNRAAGRSTGKLLEEFGSFLLPEQIAKLIVGAGAGQSGRLCMGVLYVVVVCFVVVVVYELLAVNSSKLL